MAYVYRHLDRYGNRQTGFSAGSLFQGDASGNTHFEWVDGAPISDVPAPNPTPVSPTFDPKLEANALYGKAMGLYTGGYARMGASPAPIVGPYISGGLVDMIVSFGVPSNPDGNRKIYNIWLDNEWAWTSPGGGTLPAHGTFKAETFDFIFKPGTLTQTACSMETTHYPGDENAYRPQMLLQITGLPYARFMTITGKPVPYVAVDIGDVTAGADPLDGINLGEALERIAHSPWCGMPSTFETVDVTDVVRAILIKDNFTIVDLCQNVTGEYRNLDLVIADKIRVKDRGSNVVPDFVFDRDSIIADDSALRVSRGNATGQRREHELIAIDPDQDYTAVPSLSKIPRNPMVISAAVGKETVTSPLVIDADTRQALATFSQNYQENARRKVSFQVGVRGYGIEPGDLFALNEIADGFDSEVFKCVQTTHGANWVVGVEGEAILRCSLFTQPDYELLQCFTDSTVATTITFPTVDFGLADTNRHIVVAIELMMVNTGETITSVTIGGASATQAVVASNAGQGALAAVWHAAVPAGTSGSVVINTSGNLQEASIHAYRVVSDTFAVHDTDNDQATTAGSVDVALDVPAGGIAIAAGITRQGAGFTWTGALESCTFVNEAHTTGQRSSALHVATAAETGYVISIAPTSIDRIALSAASFTI
jgi:hypothetical protein